MLLFGEQQLSDTECLAVLLRTGRRGEGVQQLAERLLGTFGGLASLARADVRELGRCAGIGEVRAAALVAAFGLARRLSAARMRIGTAVRDGRDIARLVREHTRAMAQEAFLVATLDARHRVLGMAVVSTGGLSSAPVHPREVFGRAVRAGAAAVVLAHNHPSGDPQPSEDDRRVTERLRAAGELLGIELLDHVVVGDAHYYSFADGAFHPLAALRLRGGGAQVTAPRSRSPGSP